ncbi:hypothetical protein [Paraburkholderia sp.]|uniref:hypothetical protein n=1 Tax=Paraburkholderia sp. TaxID=1926495 RepID=UPI003C7BF4B6
MAIVYVLPPAGGLQNTGYANGRTYTSNGVAIPVPDFDAAVLANAGWTVLGSVPAQLGGGGVGLKSPGVLAQSAVPASVTGTTAETVLATIAIPAGALGPNGRIRAAMGFSTMATASHTVRMRLSGTAVMIVGPTTSVSGVQQQDILAQNSTTSQIAIPFGGVGTNSLAPVTTALDMTQAQTLTITAQPGATTETMTLYWYSVEILNP